MIQEYPLSRHEMKRGGLKVQKAPRAQEVQRDYEVESVQEVQRGYEVPSVQEVQRGMRSQVYSRSKEVMRSLGYRRSKVSSYVVPSVQEVQLMYPFVSSVEAEPSILEWGRSEPE